MICPCGGMVITDTHDLESREALLRWFTEATSEPLPATITVRSCGACGRLDKRLNKQVHAEAQGRHPVAPSHLLDEISRDANERGHRKH